MSGLAEVSIPLSTLAAVIAVYYGVSALICLGVVWCYVHYQHVRQAFEEKWPPISDKQFVKLCKPGTNPNVAIRVRHILARQSGIDVNRIHPNMNILRDLDWF